MRKGDLIVILFFVGVCAMTAAFCYGALDGKAVLWRALMIGLVAGGVGAGSAWIAVDKSCLAATRWSGSTVIVLFFLGFIFCGFKMCAETRDDQGSKAEEVQVDQPN